MFGASAGRSRGSSTTFQDVLAAIGWPGVTAIMGALGLVFGGWRLAVLDRRRVPLFGVLGLWDAAIDTLALTLAAVLISLLIGIPLGILAGRSDRFMAPDHADPRRDADHAHLRVPARR